MKVIISTKSLAVELNKIDLDINSINSVRYVDHYLCLYSLLETIEIYCESCGTISPAWKIKQEDRRWDWVKKLMNQIDEQPVVLEISETGISITFNY